MDRKRFEEYLVKRISPNETIEQLLEFPRFLEIETVNSCNARCPMCTIEDWDKDRRPMTDELFDKVAEEIVAHASEVRRISLYRDGEPLMDRKLPARIKRLKDGGVKNVCISTNVSLLNEERASGLLQAGLDTIIFSIDSLKKEVYENIRVRLNFEEVMKNAHRFLELRDAMRPGARVWLRMIRQESNADEWPAYKAYWEKYLQPQDRLYFHNVFNWGGQLDNFKPVAPTIEPILPCVALWSLVVVACNGNVPLCNVDFKNTHPIGNVIDSTITELWQSAQMNEYRKLHLGGQKACLEICEFCNVWDEAPGGEGISQQYADKPAD